jgi:DNA-binding GntR family transcriptional regulator
MNSAIPLPARTSLRVQAYESFRQKILSAAIRPGQFVSQRELATLLGMPLGAIREMIPRLEAAGLIRAVPQRGLQVTHVDLKLIRNAFQVRAMIEREAVAHFIRVATDAELKAIEDRHREILQRASNGHVDAALLDEAQAVDWDLHDRMVDSMGNEILSDIYRVNSLHVRLIRMEHGAATADKLVTVMQEHLRFIEALRSRDEARAGALLQEHIESSRTRVLSDPRE